MITRLRRFFKLWIGRIDSPIVHVYGEPLNISFHRIVYVEVTERLFTEDKLNGQK